MVPGYAGTTYNSMDASKALPVGEYNKKVETGEARNPTKFIKPASPYWFETLLEQGLSEDWVRGTTTSSARREVPSMVFGISTPGPKDQTGPRGTYGAQGGQSNVPVNRLGGSSFVMDDGDATLIRRTAPDVGPPEYANVEAGDRGGDPKIPANELIRLRTRTGHQILMHNSEDLIYIGNSKGTTWIELTSNGKIDIYAKDSVSVHSENDINFTADRDINLTAGANINMNAAGTANITSTGNTNFLSNASILVSTPDGKIELNSTGASEAPKTRRAPQHEPWIGHEHLNPTEHTPELTRASTEPDGRPTEAPFPRIVDTFRQSG